MTGRYPRRFGKYVLLKPMAKGGMGEIYLAAGGDVGGFEKLCVIKKVITEKADRAKAKRFLDEAKVVLRLSHSALVTTFDAGDVGGEFYIAMELVEGKDLREVWNRCVRTRQRIPLDVALHVVREVARALAYVHGYGDLKLVHRDVAPPNILLAYVGDVKLTDFGLARSILKQEHTAPGVVFGRAAYLAPEQARGEVADARTDVYTLGIVLWELLTGQQFLQLGGLDPAAALAIVRNPKLVPPSTRAPWISPALDQVVVRALASDRTQRFQTADELRQALGEVIGDIAPRADASRVAEFLRTIYSETIDEERSERERFMKELIPQFRAGLIPVEDPAPEGTRPAEPEPAEGPRPLNPVARAPEAPADPQASPGPRPPRPTPAPLPPLGQRPRPSQPVRLPGLPPTTVATTLAATAAPARNGAPLPRVTPTTTLRSLADGNGRAAEPLAPVEPRPAGRMVGGCRLIRPLVEGRLGTLHRAVRVPAGEEVAVRVVEGAPPEAATLERMREDGRRLARLGHPNIAAISEVGVGPGATGDDPRLFAVLEPVVGLDLATVLRNERRLDGARALDIAAQVARALGAGHAIGVLHLRLEPERVLVGAGAEQVKVLDFGLGPSPAPGKAPGVTEPASLPYRAPEQLLGGTTDTRADVYAVGALLYELITGTPPHAGSADPATRKLSEPVQSPRMFRPEMPIEVERLLLSTLERDPALRPQTMAALEDALISSARIAGSTPPTGPAARPGANAAAEERRRSRRESAFRVIGELLAVAPASLAPVPALALAAGEPPRSSGAFSSAAPTEEQWPEGPSKERARPPAALRRPSALTYVLAVLGSLAVGAAVAWRLLR